MTYTHFLSALLFVFIVGDRLEKNKPKSYINSLGMKMLPVRAGAYQMGNDGEIDYKEVAKDEIHAKFLPKGAPHPYFTDGTVMGANPLEWDEAPAHTVRISRDFHMAATPVTNAQFEKFRPEHRALRGNYGFSAGDNDAVVEVTWNDAVAFTQWLSKQEGVTYRLPTEAEWEYAARAGTTSPYFTGDHLPKVYWQHQVMNRTHSIIPDSVSLKVGQTPPNAWGFHDVHGLVEEWCLDWYGPYPPGEQTDPVGYVSGSSRVTRGGSHSTGLPFLRSANRSGALPETHSFLIGFRVVRASLPPTHPSPVTTSVTWAKDVKQSNYDWQSAKATVQGKPVFEVPKTFTRVPKEGNGPLYYIHNHEPALTVLPNGDLLAIWFSTVTERGREMMILGARLRRGAKEWDAPDVFFQVPDRNLTGQALSWDGKNTIYHFSGLSRGDGWRNLALLMRKSTDNGKTWSQPEFISQDYADRHQPIDAVMYTTDGAMVLLCDATWDGQGGSVAYISRDQGRSWKDFGKEAPQPVFETGKSGGWIAGIHAGIVELKDGRWLALGRGNDIDHKMPMSISADKGKTWTYSASPFAPVKGAQRLALTRLIEGSLLLISFESAKAGDIDNPLGGTGMYAAVSYDEGKTWPVRRLITSGSGRQLLDAPCNHRWGEAFSILDEKQAEQRGYLTVEQAPDGMIHLLSSGTHYAFNLKWLEEN